MIGYEHRGVPDLYLQYVYFIRETTGKKKYIFERTSPFDQIISVLLLHICNCTDDWAFQKENPNKICSSRQPEACCRIQFIQSSGLAQLTKNFSQPIICGPDSILHIRVRACRKLLYSDCCGTVKPFFSKGLVYTSNIKMLMKTKILR